MPATSNWPSTTSPSGSPRSDSAPRERAARDSQADRLPDEEQQAQHKQPSADVIRRC